MNNLKEIRKKIIDALKKIEDSPRVIAAFLVGADVNDTVDEYSDIDFDIVLGNVDDIEEIEKTVKDILKNFSPIETELKIISEEDYQVIYQFEKISKFLHVDVLFITDADKINKSEVKVLFDKKDVIRAKRHSKGEISEKIKKRVKRIKKYSKLRNTYVERAINRGLYLEAEEKYHYFVLKVLIEAFRLLYCPEKSNHHVKHIDRDLPKEVVKKVEDLFKVSSMEELRDKYSKANELLNETLANLELK